MNEAYFTYNDSSSGGQGFAESSADTNLAIDASGNIWLTGMNGSLASSDALEVAPSASPDCSSGCKIYAPPPSMAAGANQELAIDQGGDVFVSNSYGALVEYPASGGSSFGCGEAASYASTEINDTVFAVAVNNSGSVLLGGVKGVWSLISAAPDSYGFCTGKLAFSFPSAVTANGYPPEAMGIDNAGNVWSAIPGAAGSSEFIYRNGSLFLTEPYRITGATSLALDNAGNVWLAFSGSDASGTGSTGFVLKIGASATANCASGCTTFNSPYFSSGSGEYINNPEPGAIAIDGANTAWVLAKGYNALVAITLNASASCSSGCQTYAGATTSNGGPTIGGNWLGIDGSGDVWMSGDNPSGSGGLVEAAKLAAATTTPLGAQTR